MEHKFTCVETVWVNKYFLLHGAFRGLLLSPGWWGSLDVWTMRKSEQAISTSEPWELKALWSGLHPIEGHDKKVGFFIVLALMFAKPDGFVKWAQKQYNWLKEMPGSWRLSYPIQAWQKELFSWGTLILGHLSLPSLGVSLWQLWQMFAAGTWNIKKREKIPKTISRQLLGEQPLKKWAGGRKRWRAVESLWGCDTHFKLCSLSWFHFMVVLDLNSPQTPMVP